MIRLLRYMTLSTIALCGILAGCSPGAKDEARNDLVFAVDSSRIGKTIDVPDAGVAVALPAGWLPMEGQVLKTLDSTAQLLVREGAPPIHTMQAMSDSSGISVFSASVLDADDTASINAALALYERRAAAAPGVQTRRGQFSTAGLAVAQLLVMDPSWVSFRMIFSSPAAKSSLQLDWYITRDTYESRIRTIESVAGSVRRLPHTPTQGASS